MKGKTFKQKLQYVLIAIMLLMIAVGTLFANSSYKRTENLKTTIGEENISLGGESGTNNAPFTSDDVLYSALEVAINGYRYPYSPKGHPSFLGANYPDYNYSRGDGKTYTKVFDHLDCITYVSTVLENLGAYYKQGLYGSASNGLYNYSVSEWSDGRFDFAMENPSSADGYDYYTLTPVMQGMKPYNNCNWFEAPGIDKNKLLPGDIVVIGSSHMFLYVGNAEDSLEMMDKLNTIYRERTGFDITSVLVGQQYTGDATGKLLYRNDNVTEFWTIEGNVWHQGSDLPAGQGPIRGGNQTNVVRPYLQSYGWSDAKPGEQVLIYRITKSERGSYSMTITKKNENGHSLSDAKFKIGSKINNEGDFNYIRRDKGAEGITSSTNGMNRVVTDAAKTTFAREVEINNKDAIDYYTIQETNAPNGYQAIGSILGVEVYKGIVNQSQNLLGITQVKLKNQSNEREIATLNSNNRSVKLKTDLSGVASASDTLYISAELKSDGTNVDFVWIDREKPSGQYKLEVGKQSTEDSSKYIAGARFKISKRLNNAPESAKTYYYDTGRTDTNSNSRITVLDSLKEIDTIDIDTQYASDYYTIEETAAPSTQVDGYLISGEGKVLNIEVKKGLNTDTNKYFVSEIKVNGNQATLAEGNRTVLLDKNFNVTNDQSKYIVKIEFSETSCITVIWRDEPIKGNYKIYIGKKSSDNLNGSFVPGITYFASSFIDFGGQASWDTGFHGTKVTTNEKLLLVDQPIKHSSVKNGRSYIDVYGIQEQESAEEGYIKQDKMLKINVFKKKADDEKSYLLDFIQFENNEQDTFDIHLGEKHWVLNDETLKSDAQATQAEKQNALAYIELDNAGSAITFVGINKKIQGKYDVKIKKVNADINNEPMSGVKFKVTGDKANAIDGNGYTSETNSQGITAVANNVQITKDNLSTKDEFAISEVQLANDNIVTLNETVTIIVEKQLNESKNAYEVKNAKFKQGSTAENNGPAVTKEVALKDGSKVNAELKVENGVITVTIPNKVTGEYDLKIGKKSIVNLKDAQTSTFVSGASFTVSQYLNSNNTSALTDTKNVTSENGKATLIRFSNKDKVTIDDVSVSDTYLILENSAPSGMSKAHNGYILQVNKEVDTTNKKYTISNITIKSPNNSSIVTQEINNPSETNPNVVWYYGVDESDSNRVEFIVSLDKATNTITAIMGNDIQQGDFNFNITKQDFYGTTVKNNDTTFDLEFYKTVTRDGNSITLKNSDKINLEKTDGTTVTKSNLKAPNGTVKISGIKITQEYIGKTYYIYAKETTPPKNYIGVDYDILIPVTFKLEGDTYVATKGDLIAIRKANDVSGGVKYDVVNISDRAELEKARASQTTKTINLTVPNQPKEGSYTFLLTKIDFEGRELDEDTKFKISVFSKYTKDANNVVTFNNSDKITLRDGENQVINTDEIHTKTGVFGSISDIAIQAGDLDKTYYFLVEETEAPDEYTAIDYYVVVPVKYTATATGYKATQQTAFAVTKNGNKYKTLSELESDHNKVAELVSPQKGTTINLKVPNEHIDKQGSYNFHLTKIDYQNRTIESEKTTFDITVYDSYTKDGNNKVTYGNEVTLLNIKEEDIEAPDTVNNHKINTKNIKTTTGALAKIDNISIQTADVGKTYYFKVTETIAPDEYTAIDYDVVVPITFTETEDSYVATQGTAFAVTKNGEYKTLDQMASQYSKAAELVSPQVGATISLNVPDEEKKGSFKFKLVKYIKGTETPLTGAKFTVAISDINNSANYLKDKNGNKVDGSTPIEVNGSGVIQINDIVIPHGGNQQYKVTINETTTPSGYIGVDGPITFNVKTQEKTDKYELVTQGPSAFTTVKNAKKVETKNGEVLVEAENYPEPEVHKGVKTIDNQSSGYYKNEKQKWVIHSTVPSGIKDYKKYVITDVIDPDKSNVNQKRIKFINESNPGSNVKVKMLNGRDLVENTDYKVSFDTQTKTLKVTFIEGEFIGGRKLDDEDSRTIEITYYTQFTLDSNGKVLALNQEIPNKATLTYSVGVVTNKEKDSEEPEVHTGGLKVKKLDADTNTPIAGAEFKLATSEANANAGRFVKKIDTNGKTTSEDVVGVSGSDGVVVFEGLSFGGDATDNRAANAYVDQNTFANVYKYSIIQTEKAKKDYWVVETTAPTGYVKLDGPKKVTVTKDSYDVSFELMPEFDNQKKFGKYSIDLEKVALVNNGGQITERAISGIGFDIVSTVPKCNVSNRVTEEDGTINITNGNVKILDREIKMSNISRYYPDTTTPNTTETYTIKESRPGVYMGLLNDIRVRVSTYEDQQEQDLNKKYKINKIEVAEVDYNSTVVQKKQISVKNGETSLTLEGVKLNDNASTVNVSLTVDGNGRISIKIPNKPRSKSYLVMLQKVNSKTGEIMNGVDFDVNGTTKSTVQGQIDITNGYTTINEQNVSEDDIYTITELENVNTKNVAILQNPITLKIVKSYTDDCSAFMVSHVFVTYTDANGENTIDVIDGQSSTTFNVLCKNGNEVECSISKTEIPGRQGNPSTPVFTLRAGNTPIGGEYYLQLHKTLINEDELEEDLNGVSFGVDQSSRQGTQTLTSARAGYTGTITSVINADNIDSNDEFIIKEISTGDNNVVKLKNSLKVTVSKGISTNNDKYVIKKLKLSEVNTSRSTPEILVNETTGASATLNDVELEDGRKVNVSISFDTQTKTILVKIPNRKIEGGFILKVKKTNSVTGNTINGVTFNGLDRNRQPFSVVSGEAGEAGVATIDEVSLAYPINATYVIREVDLPDDIEGGEFLKLTDVDFTVRISTKLNSSGSAYVVDEARLSVDRSAGNETSERQYEIAKDASISTSGNVVTITIPNEPVVDYDFKLKKVDDQDSSLAGAEFTIYEDGIAIHGSSPNAGAPIDNLGEYLIERNKQLINSTHEYKIYETKSTTGYKNIFQNVGVKVVISVDRVGNVTAIQSLLGNSGDIEAFNQIIRNNGLHFGITNNGNNSFTLYMPNPKDITSMKMQLAKVETGSDNGVADAIFVNRRVTVKNETTVNVQNVIDLLNQNNPDMSNSLTTTGIKGDKQLIEESEIIRGDSYYYEITESRVPDAYKSVFKKALVRIHANIDGTVSESIVAVIRTGESNWETNVSGITGVSLSKSGNDVTLSWENSTSITLTLLKKHCDANTPVLENGKVNIRNTPYVENSVFTIKRVDPNTKDVIETISSSETIATGRKDLPELPANKNTTYCYEFAEESTNPSYTNIFAGAKIYVYITPDDNGTIYQTTDRVTIEVTGVDARTKMYLENRIMVEVQPNNQVYLFIANEQKTLGLKIMKVSAGATSTQDLVGIPGVEFSAVGGHNQMGYNLTTDEGGYATIPNFGIGQGTVYYTIKETNVPEGISKIENTNILLTIDTNIENPDEMTTDRISVSVTPTGAGGRTEIQGLEVQVVGNTILLIIPNTTDMYTFNMFKQDDVGNQIRGAKFTIERRENNGSYTQIHTGSLDFGLFSDTQIVEPNTSYDYRIREISPSPGFVNVLKGYYLNVHLEVGPDGLIKLPTNAQGSAGPSQYILNRIQGETQLYEPEELMKYITMNVTHTVTEQKRSSGVTLNIVNPYEYTVTLNKKSAITNNTIKKAKIVAEKVDNAPAYDLFYAAERFNEEEEKSCLEAIANSNSTSHSFTLNRSDLARSDEIDILNNIGMAPRDETGHVWRITEDEVDAPYVNILKDKYIVFETMMREGNLQIPTHREDVNGRLVDFNFFVTDREGNNLTADFANRVAIEVSNENGEHNISVTVKDPSKISMDINKVEYDSNKDELSECSPLLGTVITVNGENAIYNGTSKSDIFETEITSTSQHFFDIKEISTVNGHKNIFDGVTVRVSLYMDRNENVRVIFNLFDSNENIIVGDRYAEIAKYIQIKMDTDINGFPIVHVYLANPVEYKFKLDKTDADGRPLPGTEIVVSSSHSGVHWLNEGSSMNFTENDVKVGDTITYTVRETEKVFDSAYVNLFSDDLTIVTKVNSNGKLEIVSGKKEERYPGGGRYYVDLDEIEYFDYEITTDEEGIDTIHLILKNPPQIEVELTKLQAGDNGSPIPGARFTIVSEITNKFSSNVHTSITSYAGKMYFKEYPIDPGEYTYRVYEDEPASPKYANVLENKYMQVKISVTANGTINISGPIRYFIKDDDDDFTNDVEIEFNSEEWQRLHHFAYAEVDASEPVKKLEFIIKNPVKVDFKLSKMTTSLNALDNVKFTVKSGISGEQTLITQNGNISFDENEWVEPGVYKYEIQELEPAGTQYDNILTDNKIVFFVKVSPEGFISFVADEDGREFSYTDTKEYYVQKLDGTPSSDDITQYIHEHFSMFILNRETSISSLFMQLENTVGYNVDVVKKNSAKNEISGANFTVIRDIDKTLLENQVINAGTQVEASERYMNAGNYTFDFIEENTVPNSAYVNILDGMYVRVRTKLDDDGVLHIVNNQYEEENYFEIYYGRPRPSTATMVDRNEFKYIYDAVHVRAHDDDGDGIYTVELTVENPINIKVEFDKKQYTTENSSNGIPNTRFTIQRDAMHKHENQLTDSDGKFEYIEERIVPGDYVFTVKEIAPASEKLINILDGKYIEVYVHVAEDGNITFNTQYGYKVFSESTRTEISSDELLAIREYINVDFDKTHPTQKLIITLYNPPTMYFNIYKHDEDGNPLAGVDFTVARQQVKSFAPVSKTAQVGAGKETDEFGKISIDEQIIDPGVYKYEVKEVNSAGRQYINVLEDVKIVTYVVVDGMGNVTLAKDSNGTPYSSSEQYKYLIVDKNDESRVVNAEIQERIHNYVTAIVTPRANMKDAIEVTVINPVRINVDIIKDDQRGAKLAGTKFTVVRKNADGTLETVFADREISTREEIEAVEEYVHTGPLTYYITETETAPGYINKLDGKFIKVNTTLYSDGRLTVDSWDLYEGSLDNIDAARIIDRDSNLSLYSHVKSLYATEIDGVYTLVAEVENPDLTYGILLNKKIWGDEEINLSNTIFKVFRTAINTDRNAGTDETRTRLITNDDGNISFIQERIPAGLYKYEIYEDRTAGAQFVNILENKKLVIYLLVNKDGSIELADQNGTPRSGAYYLFEGEQEIDLSTTTVDEFIRADIGVTSDYGSLPELDIFIKNPEKYNFELIKKDIDTDERMNGVDFKLEVYNGDQKVTLKDPVTFEEIVPEIVTTANVNGYDGVISIPDILIEKAGTYTFVLEELSTEGKFDILYKTWADKIRIDVQVAIEDGEYVVKQPSVRTGNQYVEVVNTSNIKAQTTSVTATNERIKGKYDLILNKMDSYTERPLDGAEFDITVEKTTDSPVYNEDKLYKYNEDDVTSMEEIIPGHYTVQNGTLVIEDIRIEQVETYIITLTETKAPEGYMLLDEPIKVKVTTGRIGQYDGEKYIVRDMEFISGGNHDLVTANFADDYVVINAKNEYFDLALRKSIDSVEYPDGSDDGKITTEDTEDRIPELDTDKLFDVNDPATTADYNHVKNHLRAYAGQEVIYTLRVYNEGEIDGYAEEITDHIPEGLRFLSQDEFNTSRGWRYDEEDTTLRTVKTRYLSKERDAENNLIKAVNKETGEIDYKEIQIKLAIEDSVAAKTVLTNIAEISEEVANNRTAETVDRDSETDPGAVIPITNEGMQAYKEDELTDDRNSYVPGQEDDDDFEKLIVEEFDLALRKYIIPVEDEEVLNTKDDEVKYYREPRVNASALKDGSDTTAEYVHPKEEEPVEVSVDDIVTYTIEVFNEGTVSGYASLIKDDIPEGLQFVTYRQGDGSVNDIYRWKMLDADGNEVTDAKKAKFITSDYLSKENELTENGNLIKAFDADTMNRPDSKFVRVQFRVVCKQDYPKLIKNEAQISDDSDESGKAVKDRDSHPDEWLGEDDEDVEYVLVTYMDLALRKFITGVTDASTGKTEEVTSRIPQVDATALVKETGTTAKYEHTKEPVLVHTNDVVIYTLRIFNEGSKDGYATQIKDDLPEGLEFLPNHEINKQYEWKLVDANDNLVSDISQAKYAVTNYLSKENDRNGRQNLLRAFNKDTMKEPEHKDIKIAFKVTEPTTSTRILTNEAQISKQTDKKGVEREDRDSTPNKWLGEDDEDIEHVKVLYFDLALRKWVTKAYVTQDGETTVTETGHHAEDDPEGIVKVDLKKSKIKSVVVKFEYQIRVTNEGQIAGYADEVKDYIPAGLRFDPADNPTWTQISDDEVVTDQLKDTLLQPGESAEVTIVLTWINSADNMGLKVNIAEISKDRNGYGSKDIDSTPNNKVSGEDDIDDAPVMLTVKTGTHTTVYIALVAGVVFILGLGVKLIRKFTEDE